MTKTAFQEMLDDMPLKQSMSFELYEKLRDKLAEQLFLVEIVNRIKLEGRKAVTDDYPYLTDDMIYLTLRTDDKS